VIRQAPPYYVSFRVGGAAPEQRRRIREAVGSSPLLWRCEADLDGSFRVGARINENGQVETVAEKRVRDRIEEILGKVDFGLDDIRVEPWEPYRQVAPALTEGQVNLLETIYDVLRTQDKWPPYRYLEDYLYKHFNVNIEDLAGTLPRYLTDLPPPGYPANDQQEIRLTIEGLRCVELPGASDDVDLFFRVFRRFVVEDKRLVPTVDAQQNPCLTTDGLRQEWGIDPGVIRRAFRIVMTQEPWSAGGGPIGDGSNFQVCAHPRTLRKYADVSTLDEYLERRRATYPVTPPTPPVTIPAVAGSPRRAIPAGAVVSRPTQVAAKEWDAFICHASADKESFVRGLAATLTAKGVRVWFDEFELKIGDNLRRKIDEGLAQSRYGIVVFSPSFFQGEWPQTELDGLAARQNAEGRKVILPILHDYTIDQLRKKSPPLAGLLAASSKDDLPRLVAQLLDAMGFPPPV
jgi:hypothetical protein